jgi:FkbM family methyltransferase
MHLKQLLAADDRRESIETWCRSQATSVYVGGDTALCRVLGTLLMYVPTQDRSLSPHLMMSGFWEMWVTLAIARYVKPGMRCIDVGANSGYYTLLLCDLVGSGGLVAAYEPQSDLCSLLKASLGINGFLRQGQVNRTAVSDTARKQDLFCVRGLMGSASLLTLNEPGTYTQPVLTIALDEDGWCDAPLPVDFVKIDVQGHELDVLAGMQKVIARSPNIAIAMEFTPGEHPDPIAALEVVRSYGLLIRTIGTDGIVRPITLSEAARADTGDHRMLWLTRDPESK